MVRINSITVRVSRWRLVVAILVTVMGRPLPARAKEHLLEALARWVVASARVVGEDGG